ncbi:MAG TPA: formimidoylglutamate deiminase [Myxococcales bacterium]|nr:formimidoylglutamate deiminase [Myxococcales bacterium]
MPPRAYRPDFLFSGGRVLTGAALTVSDGVVTSVGEPEASVEVVPLRGRALLPGMVTAHSHAFQRAIRGRTELKGSSRDDFWSWREAMYAAAGQLDVDDLYQVSRFCFLEMARAGITAVGEFHYLHRDPGGQPYANPNELDLAVARAARDVGLRIVLLRVAYARSGFNVAENPRQRRFIESSADEYLRNLHALAKHVPVGAAPHSVRACPAGWIRDIAAEARKQDWVLHLHVSEQPGEVAQCREEHGLTPLMLLERLGAVHDRMTAVHAVHLTPEEISLMGRARANVCACPTTERNLGDGIVRVDKLLAAGVALSVGTDSEVQLSPLEDARQLEYHLRLADLQRAILDTEPSGPGGLGAKLYGIASAGGMRSLGLSGGTLSAGEPADFIEVDLDDPSIAGANAADLMANIVFSLERTAVRATYVAGRKLELDFQGALPGFKAAMRRLWQ